MVGLVEQDAVVAHERLGVGRGAMAVEIGGSRAHDAAMVGQPASDQGFVVHRTQAKGEVHALAGQIDPAIGESELQLDIGVARRELGHQRHDLAHAEAVGCGRQAAMLYDLHEHGHLAGPVDTQDL